MQTFLPFEDFSECAKVLDWKRLGKQRVECKQINKALRGEYKTAWVNHPATRMWLGYELALCEYSIAICNEWRNRGYADAQLGYFYEQQMFWESIRGTESFFPSWLGGAALHASHRSNLLRKDRGFYEKFGWSEPDNLEYVWPAPKIILK